MTALNCFKAYMPMRRGILYLVAIMDWHSLNLARYCPTSWE